MVALSINVKYMHQTFLSYTAPYPENWRSRKLAATSVSHSKLWTSTFVNLQADELAKKTLEEFAASVKDYTAVSGVDEKRKDLSAQIQETHDRFLKKNTALMAAFCYDPLQEAYRELRMQVISTTNW